MRSIGQALTRREIFASAAALALGNCAPARASTDRARIDLDINAPGATVPALLFGTNLQWTGGGDGLLSATAGGAPVWNQPVIDRIREAGITAIRFPGGALANTYRWKTGVGPWTGRSAGLNFAGERESAIFGSDELIQLTAETSSQPVVTVNAAAGAEEAADWVEYLNGAASTPFGELRLSNTVKRPLGVRLWEVGNELFSPKEPGHMSARAYGRTVAAFRAEMRRRDPRAQVGAMLEGSFQSAAWMSRVMPDLMTWNEEVLESCAADVDFISLHFGAPYDTLTPDGRLRELTLAANLVLRRVLQQVSASLARHGRPDLPIVVSEYTAYYGGIPSPRIAGLEGALFNALVLFELMRHPNVMAAQNWSLLNNDSFGLIKSGGGQARLRPAFTVLCLLRGFAGRPMVDMRITAATYQVEAKGSVPTLQAPMLDGVAVALADRRYRLAVVNRSAATTVVADLAERYPVTGGKLLFQDGSNWPALTDIKAGAALTLPPSSFAVVDLLA